MKWLLWLYPAQWRKRYGEEFAAVLADQPASLGMAFDVFSGKLSTKGRQQHNIVFRHLFHGATGFAPCGQSAGNHVRFKSLLSEHMRHTGAGGFA